MSDEHLGQGVGEMIDAIKRLGGWDRDRPFLGQNPAGHTCSKCGEREATVIWGDPLTVNHGGGEWRCDVCAITEQLEYARERAKSIPELERRLVEAKARS